MPGIHEPVKIHPGPLTALAGVELDVGVGLFGWPGPARCSTAAACGLLLAGERQQLPHDRRLLGRQQRRAVGQHLDLGLAGGGRRWLLAAGAAAAVQVACLRSPPAPGGRGVAMGCFNPVTSDGE